MVTALRPRPDELITAASRLITPALYRCRLTHTRRQGTQHAFSYTVYLWLVDVDDLPHLPWPFSRVARFDARDHLGCGTRSLRANLDAYLALNGVTMAAGRILMLAQPRGFGYAFDPVTFFFCYRADEHPVCVIAEVRNTFDERHCYLVRLDGTGKETVPKELYVSPFFPTDGYYRMRFLIGQRELTAAITLYHPRRRGEATGEPALTAVLTGTRTRAPASLAVSLLFPRRVAAAYRTILLIHWQAWQLRRRGLRPARRRYHEPQPGVDTMLDGGAGTLTGHDDSDSDGSERA